jgi:hypothetical protein
MNLILFLCFFHLVVKCGLRDIYYVEEDFGNDKFRIEHNSKKISKEELFFIEKVDKHFIIQNINCSKKVCELPYGYCMSSRICKCSDQFAYIDKRRKEDPILCNHHRKQQIITFLLELFISFGAGHFYLHQYMNGIIKLSIEICLIFVYNYLRAFPSELKIKYYFCWNCMTTFQSILYILFFSLHFIDIFYIIHNKYYDGYGVPLISWNFSKD